MSATNCRDENLGVAGLYAYGTRAGLLDMLWRPVARLPATLLRWHRRAAERRHLSQLNDRLLKDIGLTRYDVEREVAKPFWRH